MSQDVNSGAAPLVAGDPRFRAAAEALGPAEMKVTLPPGMTAAFRNLMRATGKPAGEILGDALSLYIMALGAHKAGKAVGASASADVLETEFVGF